MKTKRYSVQYRRKREGRTDYKKRTKLLLSGMPRLIIRKTIRRMIVQVSEKGENGDVIMVTVDSGQLEKLGWKHGLNISTSYLTGYLAGLKAKEKIKGAVADLGFNIHKKGNIYAALKGVVDAGIMVSHDPSVFPSEDRIKGAHLKGSAAKEMELTIKKMQEK
ncbi:50S ribosomal protein L18 [Candidatus Woesearchaeota archaeon]|nr:50S ribosomal protein L18 [Candidatus Woesearchaeota archaeon]